MCARVIVRESYEVVRLQPAIGAEIRKLDLSQPLADPVVAALRDDWLTHKVLFFRDQRLSREQHLAFSRKFSNLEAHPAFQIPGHPELLPLTGPESNPTIERWHSDLSYRVAPPIGAVLRAVQLPALGGDTVFVNAVAVYEGLPTKLKARLLDMWAIHDPLFERYVENPAEVTRLKAEAPPRRQPMVRLHPETGEKVLYVNEVFTTRIDGLEAEESEELLDFLFEQFRRPEYQVRFTWSPGAVAMWDNRSTQHYPVPDYSEHRYMERTAFAGEAVIPGFDFPIVGTVRKYIRAQWSVNPGQVPTASLSPASQRSKARVSPLAILWVIYFFQYLDRQVLAIVIEPLKLEFSLTDTQVGLLIGSIFGVVYGLSVLGIGVLMERVNRRNLLAVAVVLWGSFTVISAGARTVWHLVVARIAVAAAESANNPIAISMLSDLYQGERRISAIGMYYASPAIASVVGLAALGWIAQELGWRMAFVIAGTPAIFLALALVLFVQDPKQAAVRSATASTSIADRLRACVRSRPLVLAMGAMTMLSIASAGVGTWLVPLFMRTHQMPLSHAAVATALAFGLPTAFGNIAGGRAFRGVMAAGRLGMTAAAAVLLAGVTLLGGVLTPSLPLVFAGIGVWAGIIGCLFGPVIGAMQEFASDDSRGLVNTAVALLMNVVGAGLGPLMVGILTAIFAADEWREPLQLALATFVAAHVASAALFLLLQTQTDLARARMGTV